MKSRRWTFLSVTVSATLLVSSQAGYSQEMQTSSHNNPTDAQILVHNRKGPPYGSPLVPQRPPFSVPKSGYAVQGRPGFVHIYNVTSVAWKPFDPLGMPTGLQRRLLSQSPTMGAVSQITYVPAGWSHPAGYHDTDMEIFVLEGDLEISDDPGKHVKMLTKYSYDYMPAGVVHTTWSRQGAVLLQWFMGSPDFVASTHDKRGARTHAVTLDWNLFRHPWYTGTPFPTYRAGGNIAGAIHTLMREDPETGQTWLEFSASIPAPPGQKPHTPGIEGYEIHPSFEEYFFPEKSNNTFIGECLNNGLTSDEYSKHTYWWRPAGVGHLGPTSHSDGTAGYSISLVRTGTRLWATYVTDCSYETGLEYMGNDRPWRLYDYNVPRYRYIEKQ
ncbi:MAG: DUF4437 domain-containing protein [Chloroflexota bacterium]